MEIALNEMQQNQLSPAWHELPPEVLENIFQKMENKDVLLSLRFVCETWNKSATSVLGQRAAALQMDWHPKEIARDGLTTQVPKWFVLLAPTKLVVEAFKSTGERILEIEPRSANFPTGSLSLNITERSDEELPCLEENEQQERLYMLFEHSGNCLRFLSIHGGIVTINELHQMLRRMKNLKVLKLYHDNYICNWSYEYLLPNVEKDEMPILKHLTLAGFHPMGFCWFFQTFAENLITLEVTRIHSMDWDAKACPNEFTKLKHLKLDFPEDKFLTDFNIPIKHLECLSIQNSLGTINETFKFISRYQTSLKELTIVSPVLQKKDLITDVVPLSIPNLIQLRLTAGMGSWSHSEMEQHLVQSKFPKIETLLLFNLWQMNEAKAREYSNTHGHWNISPTLHTIKWATDQLNKQNVENHTFTGQH